MAYASVSVVFLSIVLLLSGCGLIDQFNNLADNCCCLDTLTTKTTWMSKTECNDPKRDPKDAARYFCTNASDCPDRPRSSNPEPFSVRTGLAGFLGCGLTRELRLVSNDVPPQVRAQAPGDPTQCDQECIGGGPFCLRVQMEPANNMASKVGQAQALFRDTSRTQIAKTELMNIFGLPKDDCNRSDTDLSGGSTVNTGDPCWLSAAVAKDQGSFGVTLFLPRRINGTRKVEQGRIVFSFPDSAASAQLSMSENAFDRGFGGTLQRVATTKDSAIISTARGCISLKMAGH